MDLNSWAFPLPSGARVGHTGEPLCVESTEVLGPDVGRVGNVCARVARRMSEGAACIGAVLRQYGLAALARGGARGTSCDSNAT